MLGNFGGSYITLNLKAALTIFFSRVSHSQEHIYNYVLYDIDEWKGPTWNKLCLFYLVVDNA